MRGRSELCLVVLAVTREMDHSHFSTSKEDRGKTLERRLLGALRIPSIKGAPRLRRHPQHKDGCGFLGHTLSYTAVI